METSKTKFYKLPAAGDPNLKVNRIKAIKILKLLKHQKNGSLKKLENRKINAFPTR